MTDEKLDRALRSIRAYSLSMGVLDGLELANKAACRVAEVYPEANPEIGALLTALQDGLEAAGRFGVFLEAHYEAARE